MAPCTFFLHHLSSPFPWFFYFLFFFIIIIGCIAPWAFWGLGLDLLWLNELLTRNPLRKLSFFVVIWHCMVTVMVINRTAWKEESISRGLFVSTSPFPFFFFLTIITSSLKHDRPYARSIEHLYILPPLMCIILPYHFRDSSTWTDRTKKLHLGSLFLG